MEKDLYVVPFEKKHTKCVRDLYIDSVQRNQFGFIQDLSYHPDITDFADTVLNNQGMFAVGLRGEDVVGIGALRQTEKKDTADLCKLHVHHCHQGCGCGVGMCDFLIESARNLNYSYVQLDVVTSQKSAIRLYKRLGFEAYDQILWEKEYNGQRLSFDVLYMRKAL